MELFSEGGRTRWNKDAFSRWSAELTYSYVVDGEYYSGQGLLPPETEDEVQEQTR
jgi:hypothetical protein